MTLGKSNIGDEEIFTIPLSTLMHSKNKIQAQSQLLGLESIIPLLSNVQVSAGWFSGATLYSRTSQPESCNGSLGTFLSVSADQVQPEDKLGFASVHYKVLKAICNLL